MYFFFQTQTPVLTVWLKSTLVKVREKSSLSLKVNKHVMCEVTVNFSSIMPVHRLSDAALQNQTYFVRKEEWLL